MTITIPIPLDQIQQFFGSVPAGATQYNSMTVFDPKALVGLSGAPLVEAIVQYLRDEWKLPGGIWPPIVSIIIAILLNILLALALKNDILSAVYIGFFTGLFSSVWHEKTKTASNLK